MRSSETRSLYPLALAAALLVWQAALPLASAGEFDRRFTFEGQELALVNLIGEIQVEQATGGQFEVEVQVRGDDADEKLLDFETDEGRRAVLHIAFPIDEERSYVYPKLGRGASVSFSPPGRDGSGQSDIGLGDILGALIGKGHAIKVRGHGSGLELWADVTVRVPAGAELTVWHGAGEISAAQIQGHLTLRVSGGGITARDIRGNLLADTGSGSVEIEDLEGDLEVDTGSGGVEVLGCRGEVVKIDTGSGRVRTEGIECRDLTIDTGSGRVEALAIGADDIVIDTGSGSVDLVLDRMGKGRFKIDTGSGSIDVQLPEDASARVTADTGSGSISADVEGVQLRKKGRASFTIGNGDARMVLDAGSGSIRIRS